MNKTVKHTFTNRIVIPVQDDKGLNAQLSQHFGRALYFVIVDIDNKGQVLTHETVANRSEHFGGTGLPPNHILLHHPNALITYGMGPRALRVFQNAKVAVLRTMSPTVHDVIKQFNNDTLEELTEGCLHAHHQ
jgi:predicted Fe-Mo cluster-binding NifX family protein